MSASFTKLITEAYDSSVALWIGVLLLCLLILNRIINTYREVSVLRTGRIKLENEKLALEIMKLRSDLGIIEETTENGSTVKSIKSGWFQSDLAQYTSAALMMALGLVLFVISGLGFVVLNHNIFVGETPYVQGVHLSIHAFISFTAILVCWIGYKLSTTGYKRFRYGI